MFGHPPLREIDMHIPGTLPRKNFWRRLILLVAGPVAMPPRPFVILQAWTSRGPKRHSSMTSAVAALETVGTVGSVGQWGLQPYRCWHEPCTAVQLLAFAARRSCPSSTGPECLNFTRQRYQGTQWLNSVLLKSLEQDDKIPATFVRPPDGQHLQPAHFQHH